MIRWGTQPQVYRIRLSLRNGWPLTAIRDHLGSSKAPCLLLVRVVRCVGEPETQFWVSQTLVCVCEQWAISLRARFGSAGLVWGLRVCPYYKFPGEITAAFEYQGSWWHRKGPKFLAKKR